MNKNILALQDEDRQNMQNSPAHTGLSRPLVTSEDYINSLRGRKLKVYLLICKVKNKIFLGILRKRLTLGMLFICIVRKTAAYFL